MRDARGDPDEAGELIDYYERFSLGRDWSQERVRRVLRRQLLRTHPDKTAARGAAGAAALAQFRLALEALEVFGDPARRRRYDERLLAQRSRPTRATSRLPHITESKRPEDRARAVLHLLLCGRRRQAFARLRPHGDRAAEFLAAHMEREEFIDVAFLIAEQLERRRKYVDALRWYQEILTRERKRRTRRPCYPAVLERSKWILMNVLARRAEPRPALDYLLRAERLGLERSERIALLKQRCACYLTLGMRMEAARQLRLALELAPRLKGISRLRSELADEL